jgi:transposase
VVESTGKYQCDLVDFLQLHQYHVAVVNPKSVRHFAKGLGFLAKNDTLDAYVLAKFAELAKPDVQKKYSAIQQDINELITRRRQLVELAKLEKQHLEAARKQSLKDSALMNVKLFRQQIKQLDKELLKLLELDDEWKDKAEILKSVPGIGDTTALTLIAELPELGDVNRAEVAALVGVAPYDHDSGKLKGVRSIQGGRANLRRCLFMATTTAMRCNPLIKAFKLRLKDAKKPYKVIVIACMRKLLSIVNTMIRNNTKWNLENV